MSFTACFTVLLLWPFCAAGKSSNKAYLYPEITTMMFAILYQNLNVTLVLTFLQSVVEQQALGYSHTC